MKKITKSTLLALSVMAVPAFMAAQIPDPEFFAGFESGEGYTAGVTLNGQLGWTVPSLPGADAIVSGAEITPGVRGANSTNNYVQMEPNSSVSIEVSETGIPSDRIIIRGYYNGAGSETLEVPDMDQPVAALLGFRAIPDTDTFQVYAFDGPGNDASGANDYIAPADSGPFPANEWIKITINIRYADTPNKTFDVSINDIPHLQDVIFFDQNVENLKGFKSFSQSTSRLDEIGIYASDGDFDGNGISDDEEMRTPGADPLNPDLPVIATPTPTPTPTATPTPTPTPTPAPFCMGDANGDGVVNLNDFIAVRDNFGVPNPEQGDANGDGVVNLDDFIAVRDNFGIPCD
ncbi:MAG: hypothetical protein JJU11_17755 [Candidatus Sumerlaeia bacterium]|nr:hypothetical protein [Candidatus Sumerlaeia bacterium]